MIKPDKVIFRKWRDNGDIVAVFPEIPSDTRSWYLCEAYEHIGQHGACDYQDAILPQTVPAKPEEYAELFQELSKIGYNLVVYRRETPQMREVRRREWHRIMQHGKD